MNAEEMLAEYTKSPNNYLSHFLFDESKHKRDKNGRFAKKDGNSESSGYPTPHDRTYENLIEERNAYKRSAQKAWSRYEYQMKNAEELRAAGVPDSDNKWLQYANSAKEDAEYYDKMVSVYENERIPVTEQAIEDYRKVHEAYAIKPKKTAGEKISEAYKNVSAEAKTKMNAIVDKVSSSAKSGKNKLDSKIAKGKSFLDKAFSDISAKIKKR